MTGIIALAVVALLIVAAMAYSKGSGTESVKTDLATFFKKKPLTEIEQGLYFRLVTALPEHIVLAQVQISQLIGVKKGPQWQTWFNKISRKSADFVVCKKDFSVAAVIELDDATHQREDRKNADTDKNAALNGAGIKIIRWQAKNLPTVEMIAASFNDAAHTAPTPSR